MKAMATALLAVAGAATSVPDPVAWHEPAAPFRIVGPIYDVGRRGSRPI
ncbi:hypothetical protein [uncultured Sphingomonas sp.]